MEAAAAPANIMAGPIGSIVMMVLMQAIFVVPAFFLTRRARGNPWLVAVLGLIPLIGTFVLVFVQWRILFKLFDRIEALESRETFN